MKYPCLLASLIALLFLTACARPPLFNANFDSDTAGHLPALSPPGEPVGDSIWIAALLDPPTPSPAKVVSDPDFSGNCLRDSDLEIPSLVKEVRFYSRELTSTEPQYWAVWSGRLDIASDATSPLQFNFGNLTVGLAIFRLYQGKLWVLRGPDLGSGFVAVGDVIPGRKHTIIVTLDTTAGTYTLALIQYQGPILNVPSTPLTARSVASVRQLNINLRFDGTGHSGASYVIDDIQMLQRAPAM